MTYGEDSSSAVYESIDDYYTPEPEQPQAPTQPAVDTSKFVPVEQYQQLEQQFQQIQPQLETVNRLQQAFAPQQQPIDPQQQAAIDKVNELINAQLSPLQQQIQETHKNNLLEFAIQNGIATNARDGENWVYGAYGELVEKATAGDANAYNLAMQLGNAWQSGNYNQVQQFLKQNLNTINGYLQNTRYAVKQPVQSQTIGQSFTNNAFPNNTLTPQSYEQQINEATQKGDWNRVNQLQSEMLKAIRGR